MKKFGLILIAAAVLALCAGVCAYAETDTVSVIIDNQWVGNQIVNDAYFDLYSAEAEYLGTSSCRTATNTRSVLTFSVPCYNPGEEFVLRMNYGYSALQYYDNVITDGGAFVLGTYAYEDENGQTVVNNTFHLTGVPYSSGKINFTVGYRLADMDIKLCSGIPAAPIDLLFESLGIRYSWDAYGITAVHGGTELKIAPDSSMAYVNGLPADMGISMMYIDDKFYMPIGFAASVFGIPVTVDENGANINMTAVIPKSGAEKASAAAPQIGTEISASSNSAENHVNSAGISSRTDYLVWVSKSDFKVYVFLGSAGNWKLCRTFDCAIGKASSPTITGQFEYYSKESRWTYDNFYVGPIMRFKGGYAIHSTLLSYGGGDYDARVGQKLSHGCVRVRKPDIDWLVAYVPLYTKIYITE